MTRDRFLFTACLIGTLSSAGCTDTDQPDLNFTSQGLSMADVYSSFSCNSGDARGLSLQIISEINCIAANSFVEFTPMYGISFGNNVLPYLSPAGRDAVYSAAATYPDFPLVLNSGYRSCAMQWLLYWWQGSCDSIFVANPPGASNHESGRALDVNNYGDWIGDLGNTGWNHSYPDNDPVHFDFSAAPDVTALGVQAFQRLWNRNHPEALIAEDGAWGDATEAAMNASPPDGFAIGSCTAADLQGMLSKSNAPTMMKGGTRKEVVIEITNTGTKTWNPARTRLATTHQNDRSSVFYDESWLSQERPAAVAEITPPGAVGKFRFFITAPIVTEDTMYSESFGLVEENVTFFQPDNVTLDIAVLVDDPSARQNNFESGCNAGVGNGGLSVLFGLYLSFSALRSIRRRGR